MISIFCNGKIKTKCFSPFFVFFWTSFWPTSHVFRRMTLRVLIGFYKTMKVVFMTHRPGSTCWPWKIEKTSKTSKSVNQLNSNTFEKIFLRKKNFKKFLIFTIFSKKNWFYQSYVDLSVPRVLFMAERWFLGRWDEKKFWIFCNRLTHCESVSIQMSQKYEMAILRPFLVIFLIPILKSFTKFRCWRSLWEAKCV